MKFVLINCLALCVLISLSACNMKTNEESDDLDMDGMEQAMRQEFKKK